MRRGRGREGEREEVHILYIGRYIHVQQCTVYNVHVHV